MGTSTWTIKDGTGVFILFASTPKDFREYSSVAKLMEESFRINDNADNKSHDGQIPAWIKSTARWWADGSITSNDFAESVQFMADKKIIDISELPKQASYSNQEKMPDWIQNNAIWWVEDLISEDEFVEGIQYLAQEGIITIK